MRRSFAAAAVAALLLAPAVADARMHHPARGHRILQNGGAPPLDGLSAVFGAYGFRKLRTAYAGNAVRLRRASDNAELDIGFLGFVPGLGAPIDVAAAAAHCAATTCFGVKWYDQGAAVRDLLQATTANQPQLIFNCQNGLPCFEMTINTQLMLAAGGVTPTTGIASLNGVAQRTSGTGTCSVIRLNNGIRILTSATPAQWLLQSSSVTIQANSSVPENAWHSAIGVIAGAASSIFNIDGSETTNGTGGTDTTTGQMGVLGGLTTTCRFIEAMLWHNFVLPATDRAVLVGNQRSFWGF